MRAEKKHPHFLTLAYRKCNQTENKSFSNFIFQNFQTSINQSRRGGKGVGLGLFPSDFLQSQLYEFIEIAHIGPYYGVENDCRKFRSNRMEFLQMKKVEKWLFFGHFWVDFGYVSHIPAIRI